MNNSLNFQDVSIQGPFSTGRKNKLKRLKETLLKIGVGDGE